MSASPTAPPTASHPEPENHPGLSKQQVLRNIALLTLVTLAFALAYAQSPLFTSNQNQYFLHGLAQAGVGNLEADWLANTLDPTPIFSLLVRLTEQIFNSYAVHYLYYALLMGVYVFSLVSIVEYVYHLRRSRVLWALFVAVLVVIHSAGWRFTLSRVLGDNWAYILEDGLADQRILGPVFQPSAFGVLLILSIALFLSKRPYLAVLSAVLAATAHPTYLLSAAVLTLAYMIATYFSEHNILKTLSLGATALLAVAPILVYVYANFANTPPETTRLAREVLVNFRIPHHARIDWWFDATAIVKIALIVWALYLVRKVRPLWIVLGLLFASGALLTIAQWLTGSDALALIFPWRISTILVPVSVSLILANMVRLLHNQFGGWARQNERLILAISSGLIVVAVLVGVIRMAIDFDRKSSYPDRAIMAHVENTQSPGDTYLIPVKMQDFRLETGAPVYIDFKSIPYQDGDVLEWYRRIDNAERFYETLDCTQVMAFADEGITHSVMEGDSIVQCPFLELHYQDEYHRLYRITLDRIDD